MSNGFYNPFGGGLLNPDSVNTGEDEKLRQLQMPHPPSSRSNNTPNGVGGVGGFNDRQQPALPSHTGYPPSENAGGERLGGFNGGERVGLPHHTGSGSLDDVRDLIQHCFSVRAPWRGTPRIEDGNLREGWEHINTRHIIGNHPFDGAGDLFAPGTTRTQLEKAAKQIVEKGTRTSVDPLRRIQSFEDRIKINGQRDRVRVVVDTTDGRVITMFPVRSE